MNISEYTKLITIRKNKEFENLYDIELNQTSLLKKFDSVECHIVVYPYSRLINSKHITFNPFEEYVKDISANNRSAYFKISNDFNKFFGLFLGSIISTFFAIYKPSDLLSVQSIVSIFGAYMIGKDIWTDIERKLIDLTKNKKFRYMNQYYNYELDKNTTLTNYLNLARRGRYQKSSILPYKIDFIQQSNSQTLRTYIDKYNLSHFEDNTIHLLSLRIHPTQLENFQKDGFLFGIKLSLNQNGLFREKNIELFQSLDKNELGCLDSTVWYIRSVYVRIASRIGRFKFFHKNYVEKNIELINCEL